MTKRPTAAPWRIWGTARSPFTLPSVVSQGVTWTSNNDVSMVTSGPGPALSGVYGFFCLPHGNYATGTGCNIPGNCTDGWIATAPGTLYGVGRWSGGAARDRSPFFGPLIRRLSPIRKTRRERPASEPGATVHPQVPSSITASALPESRRAAPSKKKRPGHLGGLATGPQGE